MRDDFMLLYVGFRTMWCTGALMYTLRMYFSDRYKHIGRDDTFRRATERFESFDYRVAIRYHVQLHV